MTQLIICPKCGSDDLAFFTKRNEYRCDCGCRFKPEKAPCQPMRIFLSYGHDRNEELVLRIKSDLEALGHDVWLDREEIKFADDWRHKITDGIRSSDWMFSFLSKHSTRDPGVCLDELGIALGVKGGIVHSILVENETDVSPPPSISHLQWLDMHDWYERQQADPAEFADWYNEKFAEICRVLESETNQRFAGEIELLQKKLKPVTMDAFTASLLEKGFSGRQWLVDELNEWLGQERTSRAFVLTGEPGIGKSAFSAWLAHFNKAEVLAAVFMRYNQPQSCDPNRMIRSLAFQLACRLPDYRKHLIHLTEIDKLDEKNQSELFSYLLTEPLHLCIDGNRSSGVILIDALDEAPAGGAGVAELLARHAQELPAWLKIVATTRPEPRFLSVLAALHPRKLDADDLRNRQDIAEYLKKQLSDFNPDSKTIDAIVDKSEGIFLYAEHVVAQVLDRGLSLDRIDEFPDGLPGIYTQYFQRQFPDVDQYHATTGLALQVLLAAQEPLGRDDLAMILGWNETMIHRQLLALGSLFPETAGKVQPFHRSLGEWLTAYDKAGDYFVSLRDGHGLLATAGWTQLKKLLSEKKFNPNLNYACLYVGQHLYAAGQNAILEEMTLSVVEAVNFGIDGYGEIFGKLVDWVATKEAFVGETLFKSLFDRVSIMSGNRDFVIILDIRAHELKDNGYGVWAKFLYETNIRILNELVRDKPECRDLQLDLSASYINVGRICKVQGDSSRALEMYQKDLSFIETLVGREPERSDLRRALSCSCNEFGRIYEEQGDGGRALKMYQKGLSIIEKLVSREPEHSDLRQDLLASYSNIGRIYKAQGDRNRALEMFQKSLVLIEGLVSREPERSDLQRDLSASYNDVGGVYKAQGDRSRALEMFQKGLVIIEELVNREPERSDLQRDLSVFCKNVGRIYEEQGDGSRALKMYQKGISIIKELVNREPERSDLQRDFSGFLNLIGEIYKEQGDGGRALEMFQKGLVIIKELVNREPERSDLQHDLSVFYNNAGSIYDAQGDDDQAFEMYEKGISIIKELVSREAINIDGNVARLFAAYKG